MWPRVAHCALTLAPSCSTSLVDLLDPLGVVLDRLNPLGCEGREHDVVWATLRLLSGRTGQVLRAWRTAVLQDRGGRRELRPPRGGRMASIYCPHAQPHCQVHVRQRRRHARARLLDDRGSACGQPLPDQLQEADQPEGAQSPQGGEGPEGSSRSSRSPVPPVPRDRPVPRVRPERPARRRETGTRARRRTRACRGKRETRVRPERPEPRARPGPREKTAKRGREGKQGPEGKQGATGEHGATGETGRHRPNRRNRAMPWPTPTSAKKATLSETKNVGNVERRRSKGSSACPG